MRFAGVVATACLLLTLVGCGQQGQQKADTRLPHQEKPAKSVAERKPAASLSAVQLWEAYGSNVLAADANYTGKYVELTGSVVDVQKDATGSYCVGLNVVVRPQLFLDDYNRLSARERKWYDHGYPANVVCIISSDSLGDFTSVKENQSVKLLGRVVGSKKADVFKNYQVILDDCTMVGKVSN